MAERSSPGTTFLIRLRGSDSATTFPGLRWILKTALRTFGLRALSVTQEAGEFVDEEAGA
jgi:hypothetical protein